MSLLQALQQQNNPFAPRQRSLKEQVTEPGDPEFSRGRAGTQEQVPSAAVQYRMLQNKQKAKKMAEFFQSIGIDVPEEVRQIEQSGFIEKEGLFSKFLEAIDAPRRVINFAIQDIAAGKEEERGFRSPTVSDYFKVLFGREEQVALDTGLNASSGSQTLALFGWEEADTVGGKVVRGIADFALQVLTDPISWVTFGGSALGKKVLAEGADEVVRKTVKQAISGDITDDLSKKIATRYRSIQQEILDQKLAKAGDALDERIFRQLHREARLEAQERVLTEVRNEVITPIVAKDFANIPDEWLPLLPAYAKGGIRIATPVATLTGSKKMLTGGFQIPGTRGLGRKLVGNQLRKMHKLAKEAFGAYDNVTRVLSNIVNKFDVEAPLLRAIAKGDLGAGDYLLVRDALSSFSLRNQVGQFTSKLQAEQVRLAKLARDHIPEAFADEAEALRQLNRGLTKFIQTNGDVLEVAGRKISPDSELYAAAVEFRQYARNVLNKAWEMTVEAMGPHGDKLGFLKNYLPLTLSPEASRTLELLANSPAIVEELAVLRPGEEGLGAYIVAKMLDAAGGPSAVAGAIGTNVYMNQRELGLSPIYKLFEVGDTLMIDPRQIIEGLGVAEATTPFLRSLQEGAIDIVTLNDSIEKLVEELAAKYNVRLGPNKGRLFNENVFDLVNGYLHTMENTIKARNMITVLERNGLILEAPTKVDVQRTLSNIQRKLENPKIVKRLAAIDEARKELSAGKDAARVALVQANAEVKARIASSIRARLSSVSSNPGAAGTHELLVLPKKLRFNDEGIKTVFSGEKDMKRLNGIISRLVNGVQEYYVDASFGRIFGSVDELKEAGVIPARRADIVEKRMRDGTLMTVRVQLDGNGKRTLEVVTDMKNPGRILDMRSVKSDRALRMAEMFGIEDVRFIDYKDSSFVVEKSVSEVIRYMSDDDAIAFAATNLPRKIAGGLLDEEQKFGSLVDEVARRVRGRQKRMFDSKSRLQHQFWGLDPRMEEWDEEVEAFVFLAGGKAVAVRQGESVADAIRKALQAAGFEFNNRGLVKDADGNWRRVDTFFSQLLRDGRAGLARIDGPVLRFDGTVSRGALAAKKEKYMRNIEWLARRSGRRRYFVDGVEHAISDLPNVDSLTNDEIYRAVVSAFKGRVDNAEVAALADISSDDMRRMIVEEFEQIFGKDFITEAVNEADELVEVAFAASEFNRLVHELFSMGRDPVGRLAESTTFVPSDEKAFMNLMKSIRKHARTLGIDPNIFRVERAGLRIETPEIIESGRRAFARPSLQNIGGKPLAGKIVEKHVLDFFENMVENMAAVYTPVGLATLKETANYFVKLWKSNATVTRPGFHIRNMIGGVWNNMIIGVGVRDYAAVRNGVMKVRSALKEGKTLQEALQAISNPRTRKVFEEAWNSGLLDLSFSVAEFRAMSRKERSKLAKRLGLINPLDPEEFVLVKGGAFFMESIEDFMRMSAFHAWFDPNSPGTAKVAKEMALAAHFDYKNLTELETRIKTFVPFFVWSRRNIPLQLQMLLERPAIMQRYKHFMSAIEAEQDPVKQDAFPRSPYDSALAIGTSVVFNENTPFWARVIFDPDIPALDVAEIFEAESPGDLTANAVDFFMNNMNPAVSSITKFWQQDDYMDVNAPAPLNIVMKQLANVGFFDVSADGDVQIPYIIRTLYNTAFPFAKEYENIFGPTDPNVQQSLAQLPGEGSMLERLGLQLGRAVGIKTQTPAKALSPLYDSSKQLERIIQKAIKNGDFSKEEWQFWLERS